MIELINTKLFIPRPRSNLVTRPRLTEQLTAGLKGKLTLVAAPAGYGKTTLLSEWIPLSPRCVSWLSLDNEDNDPTRFWTYFIASLQHIHPDLGSGASSTLQSSAAPPINSIITSLINDIAAFPDSFSIVLDDYHVIDSQPINEALIFLIDHMPKNMHTIITTRIDPPMPLARLRGHNQLTEIRANDLRFTPDETSVFLHLEMGLDLSAEEVAALETRTEGWIAGLQIAALSMRGHDDVSRFIQTFSGSHRHILGYLAEEVLNHQPEDTLKFLLQTSILDRLSGQLCDAVTGESGGQAILENLEIANLFISPLDGEGLWYRYHHLFAEVLQARLLRTSLDIVPELHRRAGTWYARHGMIDEAVRHALAGVDFDGAASLIESGAGTMLRRGASTSLIGWLDILPEEIILARPRLCLARGWTFFMGPALNLESAEEWAEHANRVAQSDGSLDTDLAGEVAALRAMVAATRSQIERSLELSRQALDDLPLDSPWRSAVVFCLGTAHYLTGDLAASYQAFDEAMRLSQADGAQHIQLNSASFLAEILVFQGHLRRAMEMYQQVLAWADPGLPQKGVVMAHGGLADVFCEQDQLDTALAHIQLGTDKVDQVGGVWSAHLLYRVLARVHQARGNWADAFDALQRTHEIAQNTKVDLIVAQVAALRARLQLIKGDLETATTWAANSGLDPDDEEANHPGWREVEYLTLARVLCAQGRFPEALSLLDRLLRSAQSEERDGTSIAILATQALVYQAQGNKIRALGYLERALTRAEPEGYIRIFIDEGDPMIFLLTEFRNHHREIIRNVDGNTSSRLMAYVDTLLAAFSDTQISVRTQSAVHTEQVSSRELQVLHLIEIGLTNQEIAERLVIALSTVKSHINSLYSKVGASNRVQAIALAREQGLLSER